MASNSVVGYSEEIMAAHPVDTDTTAAPALASVRDTMSPGSLAAKETETQHMDIASPESFDSVGLSEDSPAKEGLRNFVQSSDRVVLRCTH